MDGTISLSLRNISKSFYGSSALADVSLDLREREVHIICGENGAGKSTLMKILSGMHTRDSGRITFYGRPYNVAGPAQAEAMGIVTIYQEFNLSPTISVAENIFLHREPGRFFVNRRKMMNDAQRYLDMIGCRISPAAKVAHLSTANQQMVQIAKALSQNARVLIMDEPCASITEEDTAKLFELMRGLKEKGLTIIYIDHRIENFTKVGDRITVLRDGRMMGTVDVRDFSKEEIIRMMVGRDMAHVYPKTSVPGDDIQFEIRHYANAKLRDVGFSVRKGEVFGLAGLVGAGRSEIVRAIFGIDDVLPGAETFMHGQPVRIDSPRAAIGHGIAFVPEDRKIMGFVPDRSINFNLVIPSIREMGKSIFVDRRLEKAKADAQRSDLNIRSLHYSANVRELSGGNQQKVVIGKWLMRDDIELLLMDEPTRGIDVGAKMEIYKLIDSLASRGKAIILVTSEMPELIGMCDRIAAIAEGRLTRIFERGEFSQEAILEHCI